jgi:hypothetical protein
VDPPADLSSELLARAIAVSTAGFVEVGWLREDALEVVRVLHGTTVAVTGGDVFVRQAWGFTATTESWTCERGAGESTPDYSIRSREWAREFVAGYDPDAAGEYVFVLYFSSQQDAA